VGKASSKPGTINRNINQLVQINRLASRTTMGKPITNPERMRKRRDTKVEQPGDRI